MVREVNRKRTSFDQKQSEFWIETVRDWDRSCTGIGIETPRNVGQKPYEIRYRKRTRFWTEAARVF